MYLHNGEFVYSPSDLTLFMDSAFASWMEHLAKACPEQAPERDDSDDMQSLLQEKGDKHERAVLERFIAQGLAVADLSGVDNPADATLAALQQGADVIFQAALAKPPFKGFSDFLIKVPGSSLLGDYHYEVWDTKLSKTLKPYFTVQLCCYQEMLAELQGCKAQEFVVVLGNGEEARLRTADYFYYYQSLKTAFFQFHNQFDPEQQPDPADSKSWGRWQGYAEQLLQERDHLSRVATITRSQVKKLEAAGIATMQGLASGAQVQVPGINTAVFTRLKAQASIQIASADASRPLYEVLAPQVGAKQGLALLPPHSDLDVFFDIEGFPLVEGGLEYLWGNTYFDEQGERQFRDFWAHNPEQEKQAFREFIAWVYGRWQQDPTMHIYHYANYEIAACRKLMSRYGICEHEVDQLLRNEVFVDLYKVVKGGLLIGEPKYSIKNVEHLYRGSRETEVGNGSDSVVVYEQWRETPDGDCWQNSTILNNLRDYNIDDCNSTQELVVWLRERQREKGIAYSGLQEVVEPDVPEEISERTALRDRLLLQAEAERAQNNPNAVLTEHLAWSLEFHRRESKPVFWRLFDRLGLSDMELEDDLDCVASCVRTEREPFKPTPRAKHLAYEYRYNPDQECKLAQESYFLLGIEDEQGRRATVKLLKEASDPATGLLVLQSKQEPPAVITLVPDEYVRPDPIPQAIEAVVRDYELRGAQPSAIMNFLQRARPRLRGINPGEAIVSAHNPEERMQQIISVVNGMDHTYLPIQGPPGAGKTYTGKHVIADLLRQGKRIGISSNSHKAINNLLLGAAEYCAAQGIDATFACTKNTDDALEQLGVQILANKDIADYATGPCVIGTTAWGFCRDDVEGAFDYLFIDEAGQVSVANLVGMSRAADNLILMGDQMQLGQPAQGTHPQQSGLSILDYLLHEQATIDDDMGVFLETTFRMHSAVNRFISEAIYDGKLESHPDNDQQTIAVPAGYSGPLAKQAGIVFLPVVHQGNTQASDEEVAEIVSASQQLLGRTFTDKDGSQSPIGWGDMLFVAPYNFQVNKLRAALGPKARIGSVDKFQGQEAPIVFLSMCASDAGESPRGMEFLFDKHRINVAVSRAQCLAIVVANPELANSTAKTLEQQKLVNLFCALVNTTS